jgi:Fe-S-cluster-containing dehydrogenase component/formate-dependent nitrite reductase membrane component NrfD
MPSYGFVIDLRKCIGCHACTIACKSEHQIAVGTHRCWVKSVEKGTFPDTRRFFFPVLCNQCEEAPCVRICPTSALFKRRDGIVDLHGDSCIGCRACMQACPYDQLFIDPNTRTAEKCNFCANRVENRLLPSCVSVCPTECRIFGDLDDPSTQVSQIVQRDAYMVRKPEKGTGPKVFYLGAEESVIRPEAAVRPLFYKEGQVHLRPLGAPSTGSDLVSCTTEAQSCKKQDLTPVAAPRVDYDIPHGKPWGIDMVLYLLFKAIGTGAMLIAAMLWLLGHTGTVVTIAAPTLSIVFITLTAVVLIVDLERPERFYYILTRSNPRSWMVWGAYFLMAHGALSAAWLAAGWFNVGGAFGPLAIPVLAAAILATSYTGFLFAQGLGRDLWQGPAAAIDLVAQAASAGSAALLICAALMGDAGTMVPLLARILAVATGAHLVILLFEHGLSPSPTRHHELAMRTITRGAYARLFWGVAIVSGGALPLILIASAGSAAVASLAALLALSGGAVWEYIWVEAGQSVPLS